MHYLKSSVPAALITLVSPAIAHSWVQQLMVINSNGQFTGQPGYPRNNTLRSAPGFSDPLMVHILPGQGQPSIEQRQVPAKSDTEGVLPTDPMCKATQKTSFQSDGSPRLKAAPGSMVALRYEENGHVSLPQNQPGKPPNRGNVYIYGTTQPKDDEKFLDIFGVWNSDGTGGDKRGKLLATQPFDDGRCYQTNPSQISQQRQSQYQKTADTLQGANLWCQNDILMPKDAPSGKPYTLYWVWDWPTVGGQDPNLPKGKAEIYTTCIDVDMTGTMATRDLDSRQAPAPAGNIANQAIPGYVKEMTSGEQSKAPAPAPAAPANSAPVASPSPASAAPAASAANPPAREVAPVASNSVVTVTVTAQPQPTTMATQASSAMPMAAQSQAPAAAAPPMAGSSLPASLNIAPPVMGGAGPATFQGTATPVAGTSAPQATPAPAVKPRACSKGCKAKRSKIINA